MIISVNGQLLTVADRNLLVSGSVNIYGAVVNFSPEWEGFEKVIVWKRVGAAITEPIIRPIVNGIGSIPNEIVSDPGRIRVGVAGVTATKRMPTVWSEVFEVVPGAYPGAFIHEPDPDIWQQFAAVLEEIRREAAETISTAGDVMQAATNAAQASADKAAEANQSASNAAASAQSAAESASAASASKTAASQSASDAESAKTAAESAKSAAVSAKDDAFASMHEADAAATRAARSATNAANTLASVNAQADARKAEINELASAQKTQITDLTESKKAEIQAKGDAVLASIPEDYTEVLSDMGELKQDKADRSEVELLRKKNAEQDYEIEVLKAVTKGIDWIEHEDSAEAMVKTVPSGAEGVQIDSIGAKSFVWNNLVVNGDFASRGSWIQNANPLDIGNGIGTTTIENAYAYVQQLIPITIGHVYYFSLYARLDSGAKTAPAYDFSTLKTFPDISSIGSWNKLGAIVKATKGTAIIYPLRSTNYGGITVSAKNVFVVDMTKSFGVTEASEVTNEMKALCDRYAELHPEYNSGEIVDGVIDSVKNVGKNVFNESAAIRGRAYIWDTGGTFVESGAFALDDYIAVSDGDIVRANKQITQILGYDINKNYIGAYRRIPDGYVWIKAAGSELVAGNYLSIKDVKYIRIACRPASNVLPEDLTITVNSLDTSFSSYKSETTDFAALVQKYFPNGMHGVGTAVDHFDFERMKAVSKTNEMELSSVDWTFVKNATQAYWQIRNAAVIADDIAAPASASAPADGCISALYPIVGSNFVSSGTYGIGIRPNRSAYCVNGSETEKPTGRFCYKLDTPIETDLDPADIPMLKMLVEAGGTLTFNNDALLDIPNKVTYAVKTGGAV